jgi:hypothetical protein
MSTYTELKGLRVKYLAANPSPGTAGDVWYDSAAFALKSFVGIAAWSSGGAMPTATRAGGGAGIQTAAFVAAGHQSGPRVVTTYEYDGSSWGAGGDVGTARSALSAGCASTLAAGLIFGGSVAPNNDSALTEEYDGTSWVESGDLNTARKMYPGGIGTQTAALCAGGNVSGPTDVGVSEEYNGTSWTEGNDLNTARASIQGTAGTQTTGLLFGGEIPPAPAEDDSTEEYNGTSWTTVNDMLGGGMYRGAGAGTQTSALAFLGRRNPPAQDLNITQEYDGTDWSAGANLSTARSQPGGRCGVSGLSALAAGGYLGPADADTTAVEEFNNVTTTASTIDFD